MRRKLTLLASVFTLVSACYGQNPNLIRTSNWLSGNYSAPAVNLDFSAEPPTVSTIEGGMEFHEASSSISDGNGNLQFYSDGVAVMNAQHDTMPNGSGLFGGFSSAQGSIIFPKPGSDSQYYILYNPPTYGINPPNHYYYAIVDMSLEEGQGDVIVKNEIFCENSSEAIAVTEHPNGEDFWIVTIPSNEEVLKVFLVTESGISPQFAISNADMSISSITNLRISPTGCNVAVNSITGHHAIYDFDNNTGELTNPRVFENIGGYGACFSPDGNLLYLTLSAQVDGNNVWQLWQYNLDYPTAEEILENSIMLYQESPDRLHMGIQLAPDGKIYVFTNRTSIYPIEEPNELGFACSVNPSNSLELNHQVFNPPQYVESWLANSNVVSCGSHLSTNSVDKIILSLYPNPVSDLLNIQGNSLQEIRMLNLQGRELYNTAIHSRNSFTLDVQDLEQGIYIVDVLSEEGWEREKIIVRR